MSHRSLLRRAAVAVLATAVLVGVVRLWGLELVAAGNELKLRAVPWFGRWEPAPRPGSLVWAAGFAVLVTAFGPVLARRLRFGVLAAVGSAASTAWAVLLYLADRPLDRIGAPLESRFDYLAALPRVSSPGEFLDRYVEELASYPIHVQGHPPGMVLLLWMLDRLGLDGSTPAAVVVLVVAGSAAAAVLVSVRSLLGEDVARRAAPFLVLVPAWVWVATTADGLFMGVGAWAIALVVLAGRPGATPTTARVALAFTAGALFALALHLSYGLGALGLVAAYVIVSRRDWTTLVAGAAGGVVVVAGFSAAGFFIVDGLQATAERYEAGVASDRPFGYFVVANLAVLSVSIGPAAVAGLATTRWRGAGLVWAAVASVLLADATGLSKGEVERIWLPFVPWLLAATGTSQLPSTVPIGGRTVSVDRTGLALQALVGIALAAWLRSPW